MRGDNRVVQPDLYGLVNLAMRLKSKQNVCTDIMRSAMISGSIDDVLPQMPFDRCLSLYRRIYIGCRLDGGDIGWCSYYSDFYWDAMGC